MRQTIRAVIPAFVVICAMPIGATAQAEGNAPPPAVKASPAAAPKVPDKPVLPDPDKIVLLIRTTLMTVNDAVQTGNFTVLRDKAAPAFRNSTTSATLAKSLEGLAQKRIDLSAVAIIAPQLTDLPLLDAESRLTLKGFFPGQPIGIAFDLTFEATQGSWRLFALGIGLAKTPDVKTSAKASRRDNTSAATANERK
jgi:hypothetical protein